MHSLYKYYKVILSVKVKKKKKTYTWLNIYKLNGE